jgi:hypothetical protein
VSSRAQQPADGMTARLRAGERVYMACVRVGVKGRGS